jgi:hypothetical protein
MTEPLPVILRPNGKPYRPRKIVAHPWNDDHSATGFDCGVYVLGTHDIEQAQTLAAEAVSHWFGCQYAIHPTVGWYRLGYCASAGELTWMFDLERGRAGVRFTATDDPFEGVDEPAIP